MNRLKATTTGGLLQERKQLKTCIILSVKFLHFYCLTTLPSPMGRFQVLQQLGVQGDTSKCEQLSQHY